MLMSSSENKTNNTTNSSSSKSLFTKEDYNKVLKMGTQYIASELAKMIDIIASSRVEQLRGKTGGKVPKEFNFKLFDIMNRLAAYLGYLTNKDGSKFDWKAPRFYAPYKLRAYNPAKLPFTGEGGFSFPTIFKRCFLQKRKVVDINGEVTIVTTSNQERFREAGINPYLAQDVKQLLNPKGIKVMDVSDPDKSTIVVYEITAFPLEDNYKKCHSINVSYSHRKKWSSRSFSHKKNASYQPNMDFSQDSFPSLSKNVSAATPNNSPGKTSYIDVLKTPKKPPQVVESKEELVEDVVDDVVDDVVKDVVEDIVRNLEDDFDTTVDQGVTLGEPRI